MNDMFEAPKTALAVLPVASLPTILKADDKDILGKLRAELEGFEGDITTPKGRQEIASKAYKVATAKQDLIRLGKSLTEGWRDQTKAVNDECKVIEDRMNELRDRVRAPLDEYEAREKARIAANELRIANIEGLTTGITPETPSTEITWRIDALADLESESWEWLEFAGKANKATQATRDRLRLAFQDARTREDEAEAARIAAEEENTRQLIAAENARIAREAAIKRQAAEEARLAAEAEAERKASAARVEAQRLLDEAAARELALREAQAQELARVERERQEALNRERIAHQKAETDRVFAHNQALAEMDRLTNIVPGSSSAVIRATFQTFANWSGHDRDWQEFADQHAAEFEAGKAHLTDLLNRTLADESAAEAERQRGIKERERLAEEQAETARRVALAKAETDKQAAIEKERQRVAAEAETQRIADEKRATNVAHARKVNGEIVADLMKSVQHQCGLELAEALARAIVTVVAKKEIRHMEIKY